MLPEDFMDEEDLRDAEESRHLETADSFAGFGTEQDPTRKNALVDLFRPSEDTVGIRLLKVMGWREDSSNIKDPWMNPLLSKHNRRGLGFEDEATSISAASDTANNPSQQPDQHEADFAGLRDSTRLAKAAKPKKGAFGFGILNDTGSDEDDPYSMGPQISYNKVIGGGKKSKKKTATGLTAPNPALKSKPVFLSKKLANTQGALRRCHDGRLPPDDFVLGDDLGAMASLSLQAKKYAPPAVPSNWKSALVPDGATNEQLLSLAETARGSAHNAKTRANALGEDQLPGKSVFDFISPSNRDRLAQASGRANLPPGLGERSSNDATDPSTRFDGRLQELVPKLEPSVAMQALERGNRGWMPYGEDKSKQQRYEMYLKIRAGLRRNDNGEELPLRAENMTQEDWIIEMQEFARAAHVFKQVTGDMATRFMSSTSTLPSSTSPNSSLDVDSLLKKPSSKPEDPAEAAARMGLFGQMTRSITGFYPSRLVCKRFSVPMPEHSTPPPQPSASQITPEVAAVLGKSRFQSAGFQQDESADRETPNEENTDSAGTSGEARLAEGGETHPGINEALEQEKPSQALFKAIFGSDDDDD